MILKGKESEKFLARIKNADGKEAQLVMEKITGNFKRGNESRLWRDYMDLHDFKDVAENYDLYVDILVGK